MLLVKYVIHNIPKKNIKEMDIKEIQIKFRKLILFCFLRKFSRIPKINVAGIKPIIYPKVYPPMTLDKLEKLAKTGNPKAPSIIYKTTTKVPYLYPKIADINRIAKVCKVKGTGKNGKYNFI